MYKNSVRNDTFVCLLKFQLFYLANKKISQWENKKIRKLKILSFFTLFLCLPYIFPLFHIFHSTFECNFAQLLFHPKNYFIKSLNLKSFFWNFFFFCEMSFRKVKVSMNEGNLLNYNSVVRRRNIIRLISINSCQNSFILTYLCFHSIFSNSFKRAN